MLEGDEELDGSGADVEVVRVEEIVDMLLKDETNDDDSEVENTDIEILLEVKRTVGIPDDSADKLVGALDVDDSSSCLLSDATDLMTLESSLGSGTLPSLTVHPPEAFGQAGGLNVGK